MTPVLEKALRIPGVPEKLHPLFALAHDLRWTWRADVRDLFAALDRESWRRAQGNPVTLFRETQPHRLSSASEDAGFLRAVEEVIARLAAEDAAPPLHAGARDLRARGELIAYFSAEFGLTEALPIYAGGLGILAGDHLKSSSDLGVPLVGVGLFYKEGYFSQLLDPEGRQTEVYPRLDPETLPLSLARTPDGGPPIVTVVLEGRPVRLLIRVAQVGRVPLYLLDSDIGENDEADRGVTERLYGGGRRCRLKQEIALGIGGLRALELLKLRPTIRHINEGHAAFVSLEKVRQLVVEEGLSFEEAREVAAAGNVFTTHTPVPAGIDVFSAELLWKFFGDYVPQIGITFDQFFDLGRETAETGRGLFSMAVLAMRLSAHKNAVSRLHARVSKGLWRHVTPDLPLSEVPIEPITNGVHPATWTAPEIASLCALERPEQVDRALFWRRHEAQRARLVEVARERLFADKAKQGARDEELAAARTVLDPSALTVGFARRFATYKRATLLLKDPRRLDYLLHQVGRPVQFLFAGKAHPRDEAGKEFLAAVTRAAEEPHLRGRFVFLADYDMALARALTAGCDVWLNTPERPREASGTSGMKAALNGVLNLSVLDGWWDEAPREEAGFSIGPAEDGAPDEEIASGLYEALETRVLPLFYARDGAGLPQGWIDKMLASASLLGRAFSSDRMVTEYLEQCYVPGAARRRDLKEDNRGRLRRLVAWKRRLGELWPGVRFSFFEARPDPGKLAAGDRFEIEARLDLAGLGAEEVRVELFEGPLEQDRGLESGYAVALAPSGAGGSSVVFRGEHSRPAHPGIGWALRVRPFHPDLAHPNETGLALWSGPRPREGTAYGS
ncbi:MAG TPA: alpha-glucan family phosphorylase [Thermoanaerobaculia bacterium]|nr:alpha-glucan family phosphorylase [Thermoanaerobaculia bacterium]